VVDLKQIAKSYSGTVKGYKGVFVPLSSSMAAESKQVLLGVECEQREQKGVDEGYHHHEFKAVLEEPKAGRLQGQFTFIEAEGLFDLPSSLISQHHVPSLDNPAYGTHGFRETDPP
jgi:hypothetical protein